MSAVRVVEIVGNSDGGGTQFVAALLQRLDRALFEPALVAPEAPWLAALCADMGIAYRPLPFMTSRTSGGLVRQLAGILHEMTPHIVHAHGTRAAWFATRCLPARAPRPPAPAFVYSEHLFSPDARRGLARVPWYAIEWHICRRADAVTTSCRVNAARAVAARWTPPARVALEHYGIDLRVIRTQAANRQSRAELGVPEESVLVGTVGRLIPQKGVGDLLAALALLLPHQPRLMALIVGDGPLRATLESRCRDMGLAHRVRFLGPRAEPWRILANCDVIVLPSLFEGLPLTLLEALACGLPVVATRVGGATDIITSGRNGLLVPRGTPAALAAAIAQMLDDADLREASRARGPESVQPYDLEPVLESLARVYTSLAVTERPSDERPISKLAR